VAGIHNAILTGWRQEFGNNTGEQLPAPIQTQLLVFIRKVGNLDVLIGKFKETKAGVEIQVINPGEMTIIEQISISQCKGPSTTSLS
jgi:hypothetical protein